MPTLTLRWMAGGHSHQRALAQGESVVIGRGTDCGIVLPADDRTIHRRHAQIGWDGAVPTVTALGRNGIRLDSKGKKLRQDETARLATADRMAIGDIKMEAFTASSTASGPRKLRCHNCDRIQDYAPEGMCVHCGFALASAETVFIQE